MLWILAENEAQEQIVWQNNTTAKPTHTVLGVQLSGGAGCWLEKLIKINQMARMTNMKKNILTEGVNAP